MAKWIDRLFLEGGGLTWIGKIVYILVAIVVIRLGVALINSLITRSIYRKEGNRETGRVVTITELVKKIIKYLGVFFGFLIILDTAGISPQTIIATAGIGSLAIGMGAQSLIKDVINGFFIIAEDQFSVGDLVTIGDLEGVVETLDIRVTKLRAFDGRLFIIPNGEIKIVINNQRGQMRAMVEIPIHREADPDGVIALFEREVAPFRKDPKVLGGPEVWGMTANDAEGYVITVAAYAKEGDQYSLERDLRKTLTQALKREGIPYPEQHFRVAATAFKKEE